LKTCWTPRHNGRSQIAPTKSNEQDRRGELCSPAGGRSPPAKTDSHDQSADWSRNDRGGTKGETPIVPPCHYEACLQAVAIRFQNRKEKYDAFTRSSHWFRLCAFLKYCRYEPLRSFAGGTKAGDSGKSPECPKRRRNVHPGGVSCQRHNVIP